MGLPMRKQIRLPDYDYSSPGAYFVTICTHEKRRILSSIPVGALHEAPAVRFWKSDGLPWDARGKAPQPSPDCGAEIQTSR